MNGPFAIAVDRETVLEDIHLSSALIPARVKLRFLSVVDTDRIPLHLTLGTSCGASTTQAQTSTWFSAILTRSPADEANIHRWWQQARTDSPLGILVAVEYDTTHPAVLPRATELLFYATIDKDQASEPLTPPVSSSTHEHISYQASANIRVIALSSDLAIENIVPSPPQSPWDERGDEGVFLSRTPFAHEGIIHRPPTKRRKTAHDAFDEATERRKQARRKGGQRVSSAAGSISEDRSGLLKHERSASASTTNVPMQTRPLSRAGSVVSVDPRSGNAKAASGQPESRSKLSSSTMTDIPSDELSLERKNKDVISRVVMAGMRLHGFVQSKPQKAGGGSSANPTAAGAGKREAAEEGDEYKLVYHQVFKGACFAFRRHMTALPLSQRMDATRNVVDELLALYCSDPLASSSFTEVEEATPSGRPAFGSAQSRGETGFPAHAVATEHGTPSVRKAALAVT